MIEFVSATRDSLEDFRVRSPLGKSLLRLTYNRSIMSRIAPNNTTGLPEIYNRAIDVENGHDIIVFVHDDVFFDDFLIGQRIVEGLKVFDVLGLAGNRRRVPMQKSWASVAEEGFGLDDRKFLSGMIAHGGEGGIGVSVYGSTPAPCELLDGVLLATRRSTLKRAGIRFDERFKFHFYDMDFCRTARNAGLRLGTWPIAVTHLSVGRFGSSSWREAMQLYFEKWGD